MAKTIDSIPEKTRWEMATQGLTGAYLAISNALKQAVDRRNLRSSMGRSGMKQEREPRNLLIASN